MRSHYTAIIHLRDMPASEVGTTIELTLGAIRGVHDAQYEPAESLITVAFDHEQTGLAEIVRAIEDIGPTVSGVAQRRSGLLRVA